MNSRVCIAMFTGCALLLPAHACLAQGNYPQRPVRFIIPFAPGGAGDFVGRIVAQKLADLLGQPMVADNRPGASGFLGVEIGASAKPDGYTILLGNNGAIVISPAVYTTSSVQPTRDLAPITQIVDVPSVLVVHPSLPVKSVRQLIDFAKARPGKLNFGSGGRGTPAHVAGEIFKSVTRIDIVHVPYKGGILAVMDTVAGQIDMSFADMAPAVPQIKAAKLRALAVTSVKRSALLPEVPTLAESGLPDYQAGSWYGVMAPAGTPRPIIERLHATIVKALRQPDVMQRLAAEGAEAIGSTPEEFAAHLKTELARVAAVVRAAGIKIE